MKHFLFILCLSMSIMGFSQIQIGSTTTKKQTEKNKKNKDTDTKVLPKKKRKGTLGQGNLSIYAGFSPTYSFRNLSQRDGVFGKPLGLQANERPTWTYSTGIGVRANLHKYFALDIGFSYLQTGEGYKFSDSESDSTYNYKNTYHGIGVNLKFLAKYRVKNFSFYLGGGISPNMFLNYTRKIDYNTIEGNPREAKEKSKDGFKAINLDVIGTIGMTYHFNDLFSIYLMPEFRYGVIDTYAKQTPHVRKPFGLGIHFGISIDF